MWTPSIASWTTSALLALLVWSVPSASWVTVTAYVTPPVTDVTVAQPRSQVSVPL